MQIDFYSTFSKKENSTLRPSGSASLSLTGHLIEPCSVLNPTVRIERLVTDGVPEAYTYAYIPVFQRYYFVNDWTWSDGLWQVSMTADVLGSWRTYIGNLNEYILRTDSTTTDFNGAISDSAYPATTDFDIDQVAFTNPFVTSVSNGTYVVGIISGDIPNAVGAITYYAMTATQFGDLKGMLFGTGGLEAMGLWDATDGWLGEDMTEEIFKTMYNPYQYIVSCTWFPVSYSDFVGTVIPNGTDTQIHIGWWGFNLSGKRLSSFVGGFHDSVEMMPTHPQASTRGKYLNYAPYTKYTLYGKFGSLPIDTTYLEIGSYLVNYYTVDYITGQCLFQVFVSDNTAGTGRKLIAKTEFLLGVPVQLAQIGRDYLGTAVNAIDAGKQAALGAMTGFVGGGVAGAITGAIASAGSAIYNTIDASMPQLQTSGVNGSFIENELSTILIAIHYVIVDENISHKGRPLCENRTISNLTGFVQCAEGDHNIPCLYEEKKKISEYLIAGFYWE